MAHKSFINEDGIIEVSFDGDINTASLTEVMGVTERQLVVLTDRGLPTNVLVDFTHVGKMLPFVKNIAVSGMKDLEFRKMAGFGADVLLRGVTNTIAKLSGRFEKTRHFKTREEAIAWLKA